MICLAVTYVLHPGHEAEAVDRLRKLTAATRAEPGCRMYQVHRSPTDPLRFFLYEQYDDQASLDAHRASPHFLEHVRDGMSKILASRTPEVYVPLED